MKTIKDLVYGKTGTVEFYYDAKGGIRFRIKANNGETISGNSRYPALLEERSVHGRLTHHGGS